jgi:histidinol-phosphatase
MSVTQPSVTAAGDPDIMARLELAQDLADASGELIMSYFGNSRCAADTKDDGSPVTDADRGAETLIRTAVAEHFGDDGLFGEEHGAETGTSGYRWVIDPIDGTISFVHGVPAFGTLIGIERDEVPVAGVMNFPAMNERAWAALGCGAWHRIAAETPRRVHVSDTTSLDEAMVCTTSFDYFRDQPWEGAYLAIARASKRTRGWSDCHSELLLVTGRIDAVVEPVLHPWDISAIIAVLHEAGGRFSDWSGQNEGRSSVSPGLASNGRLHEQLCATLTGQ